MPKPNSGKKNTGVKMMLLVNMSLKMDKGKLGAQCGHGAIGLYKQVMGKKNYEKILEAWESNGQKKICAKLKDDGEMNLIISKLTDAGIAYYTVVDAGKTQVAAGSRTILAVMDYENKLNQITGTLKLL